MPSQIFEIHRAPEARKLEISELRSLLFHGRPDSEWDILEKNLMETGFELSQEKFSLTIK